ncbi:Ig-like domain-containing protein [Nonomuraea purpurea]|uniref:Ig-like domain-containing protein n=1 Tax=Nonomuraea purpurea TaxID=1849276 RepID=A0ABV8FW15_9ACTN
MAEVLRFYYEGEPEPQAPEEWEAFMNDPERSRSYPEPPAPRDITAEELLAQQQAVNTRSIVKTTDLLDTPPEPSDPPAEDTDPPTVVAAGPDKDATGVPLNTEIWAVFSESVTEAQMALKGPDGRPVAGASRQENADIASFGPEQLLAVNTHYTVEVSGAKDAAGNVMPNPHNWSFTTGETTTPVGPPTEHAVG